MPTVAECYESMEYGPAPESATIAMQWIRDRSPFKLFIGGEWANSALGDTFESVNPANSKNLATVAQGGPSDIDSAVTAARKAQPEWWAIGGHARARYLYA